MRKVIALVIAAMAFCSCSVPVAPNHIKNGSVRDYTYAYIIPTSTITSSQQMAFGNSYVAGPSSSVNPSEVIAGYLMKEGYSVLPSINPELADKTLVASFGYVGRRGFGFDSYATIIIVQFRDARTHELVESCEAEGVGQTEADDYLIAIKTALNVIFHPDQPAQPMY